VISEGFADFRGHRTWFHVAAPESGAERTPLLLALRHVGAA
jgi:hypothetical protein